MKQAEPGRLVIHMGVQKTGSTAFHHFAGRNRAALEPYLHILTPAKATPARALGRMAGLCSLHAAKEPEFAAVARELRDSLLNLGKTCLISHENLPGAMPGRDGVVTLYPQIEHLLEVLDREFEPFEPEYVIYTRSMTGWKRSVHNQAVKSDRYAGTIEDFQRETADCGTWASLQARVEGAVGKDRCRFFALEDETDRSRPGTQLLRYAGVPEAVIAGLDPIEGARNQSLTAGALEFLRLANALDLPQEARRPLSELVQRNQGLFATAPEVQ
jgi:hypothetical protein